MNARMMTGFTKRHGTTLPFSVERVSDLLCRLSRRHSSNLQSRHECRLCRPYEEVSIRVSTRQTRVFAPHKLDTLGPGPALPFVDRFKERVGGTVAAVVVPGRFGGLDLFERHTFAHHVFHAIANNG